VVIETGSVRGGVPIVSRAASVSDDAGIGYTITAEAPEGQWDASVATLEEIVASARFEGGGGGGAGAAFLILLLVLAIGGGAVAALIVLRRRKAAVTVPSQDAAADAVPADWYPDPSGRARLRYWDGIAWTDHTAE
jgi:hypothetical protein